MSREKPEIGDVWRTRGGWEMTLVRVENDGSCFVAEWGTNQGRYSPEYLTEECTFVRSASDVSGWILNADTQRRIETLGKCHNVRCPMWAGHGLSCPDRLRAAIGNGEVRSASDEPIKVGDRFEAYLHQGIMAQWVPGTLTEAGTMWDHYDAGSPPSSGWSVDYVNKCLKTGEYKVRRLPSPSAGEVVGKVQDSPSPEHFTGVHRIRITQPTDLAAQIPCGRITPSGIPCSLPGNHPQKGWGCKVQARVVTIDQAKVLHDANNVMQDMVMRARTDRHDESLRTQPKETPKVEPYEPLHSAKGCWNVINLRGWTVKGSHEPMSVDMANTDATYLQACAELVEELAEAESHCYCDMNEYDKTCVHQTAKNIMANHGRTP